MENDYPAAHSMDAFWFAVDKDGHVGYFDTGEAGAFPAGAYGGSQYGGSQAGEVDLRLMQLLSRTQIRYDLSGQILPALGEEQQHSPFGENRRFFFASLDPVRDLIAAGQAYEVPATTGVAVVVRDVTDEISQRLHAEGACRGCFWHWEPSAEWNEEEQGIFDMAALGFFHYSHLCENWIAGPYGRMTVPEKPIHVDQLPPDLRSSLAGLRFATLCFADTPHIQPAEFTPCDAWGKEYLASDGTTRRPLSR